jgi:hypothetical protein
MPPVRTQVDPAQIAATLEALFLRPVVGASPTRLRREDVQKAAELGPLLAEVARAAGSGGGVLVDAAAGKSPVGLIAAELLLAARSRPWRVVVLERDAGRADACRLATRRRVRTEVPVEVRVGEVADAALWPEAPSLVVALHACGAASDAILDRAVAARARRLLLVPCCYGAAAWPGHRRRAALAWESPPGQALAERLARKLAIPSGLVGRRFAQALIDAERTLRLEEYGYQTEVVELFSPQVSPFNLLWRSRRVGEPNRMRAAAARRAALLSAAG